MFKFPVVSETVKGVKNAVLTYGAELVIVIVIGAGTKLRLLSESTIWH